MQQELDGELYGDMWNYIELYRIIQKYRELYRNIQKYMEIYRNIKELYGNISNYVDTRQEEFEEEFEE